LTLVLSYANLVVANFKFNKSALMTKRNFISSVFDWISEKKFILSILILTAIFGYVGYRFASKGGVQAAKLWTDNGVVVSDEGGDQTLGKHSVASSDDEGAFIVWNDIDWNGSGTDNVTKIQKFNKQGVAQWNAGGVDVCSSCSGDYMNPMVTRDGSGGAVVIWEDSSSHFYAQRLDSSGTIQWAATGVQVTDLSGSPVHIGTATDDDIIFVFNNSGQIYVQSITSSGSLQFGVSGQSIPTASVSQVQGIQIGNSVFLAWDQGSEGNKSLYVQKIDATDGSEVWTSGGVELGSVGWGGEADISSDGSGGMFLVWTRGDQFVYAQRVDSTGSLGYSGGGGGYGGYGNPVCNANYYEGSCGSIGDQTTCETSYMEECGEGCTTYNCYWYDYGGTCNMDTTTCDLSGGGSDPVILNPDEDPSYIAYHPKVTYGPNGDLYAAWSVNWGYEAVDWWVNYQKVNSSGDLQFGSTTGYEATGSWKQQLDSHSVLEDIVRSGDGFLLLMREFEYHSSWDPYSMDSLTWDVNHWSGYQEADLTAQLYDSTGMAVWDSPEVVITNVTNGQGLASTAYNGAGGMIAAWHDYRGYTGEPGGPWYGERDIYAQYITPAGRIDNLPSGLGAVNEMNVGEDLTTGEHVGEISVGVRDMDNDGRFFAGVWVGFNQIHNWSGISGSATDSKSFLHYDDVSCSPNCTIADVPGTQYSDYTLYIPIPEGRNSGSVRICPDATNLTEVTEECANGETFTDGETKLVGGNNVTVTKVTLSADSKSYWKATGVTGTGGVSLLNDFALKDTLSRLEVSQASTHTIEFGTIEGIGGDSADTIEITFDPVSQAWDLGSITVDDIDMAAGGSDLTLCTGGGASCSAAAGTWGIDINTTTDVITFTAPTDGVGAIAASTGIVVEVGDNATYQTAGANNIVNPGIVADYEVHMKNTYNSGSGGVETGEVEIPIVDDDTVNITGYIDTTMSFDIDTAVTDVQCDAAGGTNPCDSHGGATDDSGYIVDLGEMTTESVNASGGSVLHADGSTGDINYIWFDLETNAASGAIVSVVSANGGLDKGAGDIIPSVSDGGAAIVSGSGLYGINHASGLTNSTVVGTLLVDTDCDDASGGNYCDVPTSTPETLFHSDSLPVDDGRLQISVGASPDSEDATGTYTDQLTFVATSTF
jgi:hypothetical protein